MALAKLTTIVPLAAILASLRATPDGLTVKRLCEIHSLQASALNSRMSKAYCYGLVDRRYTDRVPPLYGRRQLIYLYKPDGYDALRAAVMAQPRVEA